MFVLPNRFLVAAEQKAYDDANSRFAAKIKELFKEKVGLWSEEELLAYVLKKRELCFQLSIYTERGILGLLCIHLLFGEDFFNTYLLKTLQQETNGDEIVDSFFKSVVASAQ